MRLRSEKERERSYVIFETPLETAYRDSFIDGIVHHALVSLLIDPGVNGQARMRYLRPLDGSTAQDGLVLPAETIRTIWDSKIHRTALNMLRDADFVDKHYYREPEIALNLRNMAHAIHTHFEELYGLKPATDPAVEAAAIVTE